MNSPLSKLEIKRHLGHYCASKVQNGSLIGIGSGTTSQEFIKSLGKLVQKGLSITAIPTSLESEHLAQSLNIPLTTFKGQTLDLTVDGADEVDFKKNMIKGLGGALLREKIIAQHSKDYWIMIDQDKYHSTFTYRTPLPIEILPFAYPAVSKKLEIYGLANLRLKNEQPFISDNGCYICDLVLEQSQDLMTVANVIKSLSGVVDHGLFTGLKPTIFIGSYNVEGTISIEQV